MNITTSFETLELTEKAGEIAEFMRAYPVPLQIGLGTDGKWHFERAMFTIVDVTE